MKHIKKLFAAVMVVAMAVTMMLPTMAAGETGSITINGISAGNTYEIYKLLDLESYNKDTGVYSYKVNSAWTGFFNTVEAKNYMTVDAQGYATWTGSEADADVAAFAQAALAWAKAQTPELEPVESSETPGDFVVTETSGKFSGLTLGYYLIDSTMGALCGLTTTNPDASIQAKNSAPTIDKQVKEDSTDNWGNSDTADIGQTVEFRTTISVHDGAQNYILHDKMSAGLTFQEVSKIEHVVPDVSTTDVPTTYYEVVTSGLTDGCTFEIKFTQAFCDHLETNDKVIVYYTAVVNEQAVIAGDGNTNEAWLAFGEDHETTHDTTSTYTYEFDLVKTDGQFKLINGAEFQIFTEKTGGTVLPVVKLSNGNYRVATAAEIAANKVYVDEDPSKGYINIVVKDGKVTVSGLDNGKYYLEERVTPQGYNQLAERQDFTIADANKHATFNDGVYSTGSGVHVVNKSGTMLPETGGIGTTIFYVVGGLLVVGAGVLLVTKKRMGE